MAANFDYGYNIDNIDKLKGSVDKLYQDLDSYINSNMGKVTDAVNNVWTGDDALKFNDAFSADVKTLYIKVNELVEGVGKDLESIKQSWIERQTNNATDMSNLGQWESK